MLGLTRFKCSWTVGLRLSGLSESRPRVVQPFWALRDAYKSRKTAVAPQKTLFDKRFFIPPISTVEHHCARPKLALLNPSECSKLSKSRPKFLSTFACWNFTLMLVLTRFRCSWTVHLRLPGFAKIRPRVVQLFLSSQRYLQIKKNSTSPFANYIRLAFVHTPPFPLWNTTVRDPN